MIVTLTPNPSLDRTIEIDELTRGRVIRAKGGRVDPGGKGVNVARALAAAGVATTAVLPSGGLEGRQLTELLAPEGVAVTVVAIDGSVRANVTVVEPDGTTTKINEPGPKLSPDETAALLEATYASAQAGGWIVGCGSLPPGVAADFYAELIRGAHERGSQVAIDSSGDALRLAVAAGPDLVKPNREELAEATGLAVATLGDVLAAVRALQVLGARTVLASLGADGALLVEADGGPVHYGTSRVDTPRSTVGAGDAMLAGFLSSDGGSEGLRRALGFGAAAASLPGSRMPRPEDVAAIDVTLLDDPDLTLRLEPLEGDPA